MTTFYFARHGKSQANQENAIATNDSPLTKEGEAQARKLGRELKKADIAVIASSPLDRAQKTAEIIAKQLKITDVEVIDDLRERGLGELEGRPKDQPSDWYYSVEGQMDVEPRGVVIARAEAALAKIKKLAVQGNVLVIGHAVSGYYLREVAAGKRRFEDFDPPKTVANGSYVKVEVADPIKQMNRTPRLILSGVVALILIAAILVTAYNQSSTPQSTGVKQTNIPLSPSDYQDDPNLQGAIQKQLQQQGSQPQDATGTQSPQTPSTEPLQAGGSMLQASPGQ